MEVVRVRENPDSLSGLRLKWYNCRKIRLFITTSGSGAMKSFVHQVLRGVLPYPVVGIYVGIGITLTGVSLSQVAIMVVGVSVILLSSFGLISGKDD